MVMSIIPYTRHDAWREAMSICSIYYSIRLWWRSGTLCVLRQAVFLRSKYLHAKQWNQEAERSGNICHRTPQSLAEHLWLLGWALCGPGLDSHRSQPWSVVHPAAEISERWQDGWSADVLPFMCGLKITSQFQWHMSS